MSKNNIILIVVVVIVALGFVFYQNSSAPVSTVDATPSPEGQSVTTSVAPSPASTSSAEEYKIEIKSGAFSPKELTIKKGEKVTWVNNSDKEIWPASANHPDHKVYDDSSKSEHCPDPKGVAFDSCVGIKPGSSWSFTFDKVGSWAYHDHLSSKVIGTIIVK